MLADFQVCISVALSNVDVTIKISKQCIGYMACVICTCNCLPKI